MDIGNDLSDSQTRGDSYSFRDGFHSLSSDACANRGLEPRVVRDEEGKAVSDRKRDSYYPKRDACGYATARSSLVAEERKKGTRS
jgi:hypothetical protein